MSCFKHNTNTPSYERHSYTDHSHSIRTCVTLEDTGSTNNNAEITFSLSKKHTILFILIIITRNANTHLLRNLQTNPQWKAQAHHNRLATTQCHLTPGHSPSAAPFYQPPAHHIYQDPHITQPWSCSITNY